MDDGGEEEDGADDPDDDGDARDVDANVRAGSGRGRGREGDDANHAHYDDDESHEAMLSMDDGYGSGVLAEEQAAQSAEGGDGGGEKGEDRGRVGGERGARGRSRARGRARGGALPERSNKAPTSGAAASRRARAACGARDERTIELEKAMVDATGVWIRVRRAQRTRRGEEDGVDGHERVASNHPKSWVTAADAGEMWEICTGPRNPRARAISTCTNIKRRAVSSTTTTRRRNRRLIDDLRLDS